MFNRKTLAGLIAALALSASAHATSIGISADGSWHEFDVDSAASQFGGTEWIDNVTGPTGYVGDGSVLTFTFTVSTEVRLDIVDAGLSGDTFTFAVGGNGGIGLGQTSNVAMTTYETAVDIGTDFDGAFADHANFSFASFFLAPGTYTVGGNLLQSLTFEGDALNATVGALRVTAVPAPAAVLLMAPAMGLLAGLRRRRA